MPSWRKRCQVTQLRLMQVGLGGRWQPGLSECWGGVTVDVSHVLMTGASE